MGKRKPYTEEELAEIASGYDVLQVFYTEQTSVYNAIRRRGLKEKLCAHMKRGDNYRTEEDYAAIVSKYDTMREFREKEPKIYDAMLKRGLVKKLCGRLRYEVKPSYSLEELAAVASIYDDYHVFCEEEPNIRQAITNRGLTDKLCKHMYRKKSKDIPESELAAIALKYNDVEVFMKEQPHVFDRIRKRGLKAKLCGHMKQKWCHRSDTELAEVASGYDVLQEFREVEPKAYREICRRGLLDELCSHMVRRGMWSKRQIYVFTFSDGYAYIGLSMNPKYRYSQHTKSDEYSPVFQHIRKTKASYEFNILTDWLEAASATKIEDEYIKKYAADGWKMLNKAKGGALGGTHTYNDWRLSYEAGKYNSMKGFMKGSPRFYKYMKKHGLLDKYCSHMKPLPVPHGYWTLEKSIETAKKCDSRKELFERYPTAYEMLRNAGLIKKLIPMKKGLPKEIHMARIAECNSRSDLYYKYQSTYNWALRKGILDSLFTSKVHERTYDENLEIIKSCKTRRELREKYGRVYKWGLINNLLDEYLPLEQQGFSDEEKLKIISSCSSRKELHDNHRSIHQWAKKNGLLDKYFPK